MKFSIKPKNFLVALLLASLNSVCLAASISTESATTPDRPAWLGLTPLYVPDPSDEQQIDPRIRRAEEVMTHGRQGFWYGLGGLVASVVFDKLKLVPGRTLSYATMGLGWMTWLGSYGQSTSILSNEKFEGTDNSPTARKFAKASTQGEIGEASNMFIIPNGAYVHPIYNDVNGGTDKLLTGSLKLGISQATENYGWESVAYWRLLTPSFKHEFGLPDAPAPVGRYADWQEHKTSFAGLTDIGGTTLRHQISVGYNDVGPKGGKELHQAIHRLTRNSLDHLDYTDQPEGRFWSFNEEIGLLSRVCLAWAPCLDQAISIEATQGRFMVEAGVRYNLLHIQVPKLWESAVELRLLRQLKSEVYSQIRPWRYEAAIGFRILKVITPTVKYVAPYLYGDEIGQSYFDILHYNFEF